MLAVRQRQRLPETGRPAAAPRAFGIARPRCSDGVVASRQIQENEVAFRVGQDLEVRRERASERNLRGGHRLVAVGVNDDAQQQAGIAPTGGSSRSDADEDHNQAERDQTHRDQQHLRQSRVGCLGGGS